MSKASEWVKQMDAAREVANAARQALWRVERDEVPNFFMAGRLAVFVDADGTPVFEAVDGKWSVEDALALARWILDTFGEPAEETPR